MFGINPQKEAFGPEKLSPSPPGTEKERDLSADGKETETAKILPFVRPAEKDKKEKLEEGFERQKFNLISRGVIIGTFYPGFPTKIVPKGEGVFEVWEQKSVGLRIHIFEKVDEITYH